jgi:hypothetical protein
MSSNINPNNIDGSYPVAGQDNNSQGFRDNFTNIKQNFQYAEDEISDLQNQVLLKSALIGQPLDNNMNDNLIYAAHIRDFAAPRTAIVPAGSPLTATVNYATSHYQTFSTTAPTTLAFTNFPTAGNYGYVKLQINITNVAHDITLPAAVSLGLDGVQGISPGTPGVQNTITFESTGYYELAFGSYDGGSTITLFDLSRGLTNFVSADLEAEDITATGNVSAAGTVTGGNISGGSATVTGNVTGGNIVTGGRVTAVGNVVGGNLTTAGLISATGNVTGGNVVGYLRPAAGGATISTVPLQFVSGALVSNVSTTVAGTMEFDGTVIYSSPVAGMRGVIPSYMIRVQSIDNTLIDDTSPQSVFSSPTTVTLAANTTYEIEAQYVIVRSAGSTSRTLSTLFAMSSALDSILYTVESTSTSGNLLGTVSRIHGNAVTALAVTAASTATDQNITVKIKGLVKTNGSTTLIPQVQFSAAAGGAATVLANGYFKTTPLGTGSVTSVGPWS